MDRYEELAREFMEIVPKVRGVSENKYQMDKFSKGEGFMLGILKYNGGSLMSGELAKIMNVSTARIACICKAAEKRGLIERKAVHGDRRKCEVCLTEVGEEQTTQKFEKILSHVTNYMKILGLEDAENLIRISEKSLEIMKEHV